MAAPEIKHKGSIPYQTYHEGEDKVLKINLNTASFPPSIEYSEMAMSFVIDILLQESGITTIVLSQQREYDYDASQTHLLEEIAALYRQLNREERYKYSHLVLDPLHERYLRSSYSIFQRIISKKLKEDPLAAYVELKRLERNEKRTFNTVIDPLHKNSQHQFVSVLLEILRQIEELKIIKRLLPHLKEYTFGERALYNYVFHPLTRPDFMYTKLLREFPVDGELLESYNFGSENESVEVNMLFTKRTIAA